MSVRALLIAPIAIIANVNSVELIHYSNKYVSNIAYKNLHEKRSR